MSDLKQKILTIMEKNSKVSVADLAILLGDTEENVARAIYEMEQDKIICGYHTLGYFLSGRRCIPGLPGRQALDLLESGAARAAENCRL